MHFNAPRPPKNPSTLPRPGPPPGGPRPLTDSIVCLSKNWRACRLTISCLRCHTHQKTTCMGQGERGQASARGLGRAMSRGCSHRPGGWPGTRGDTARRPPPPPQQATLGLTPPSLRACEGSGTVILPSISSSPVQSNLQVINFPRPRLLNKE